MPNTAISDPITFDGVDFNSIAGWMTTGTDTFLDAVRDVRNYHVKNTNESRTVSNYFESKKLTIRGIFAVSGREALDSSITRLKEITYEANKNLVLPIAGVPLQFENVTVENIVITNVAGGYAEIEINFVVGDPYSYATTTSELLNVINLASGNKSYPVFVEGSGRQVPVITYTVDSVTGGTDATVTFSNPITGIQISINRTFTAAEVLVIDCKSKTVKVDGANVEFSGNLMEWATGNGFVNYTDTFTTRQVDINVTYRKRYL